MTGPVVYLLKWLLGLVGVVVVTIYLASWWRWLIKWTHAAKKRSHEEE